MRRNAHTMSHGDAPSHSFPERTAGDVITMMMLEFKLAFLGRAVMTRHTTWEFSILRKQLVDSKVLDLGSEI